MNEEHERWMDTALEEAQISADKGNTFVGAVIVKDGEILGRGGNRATSDNNPLKHAETVAIEAALEAHGKAALVDATLYSTMEPCPYCAWAIQSVKIKRLVLGARFTDLNRTDLGDYSVERLLELTGRKLDISLGIRAEECVGRRAQWMKETGRIF